MRHFDAPRDIFQHQEPQTHPVARPRSQAEAQRADGASTRCGSPADAGVFGGMASDGRTIGIPDNFEDYPDPDRYPTQETWYNAMVAVNEARSRALRRFDATMRSFPGDPPGTRRVYIDRQWLLYDAARLDELNGVA
jgi:hypothetical protein